MGRSWELSAREGFLEEEGLGVGMIGASLDSELFVTQWAKSSRSPALLAAQLCHFSLPRSPEIWRNIPGRIFFLPPDIFNAHLGGLSLLKTLGTEFSETWDSSHCFPLCECLPPFPLKV